MGWGRIQELPGIFAQALSTAKKGDIVGPIRSGVGFHILKVNDLARWYPEYLRYRGSRPSYSAEKPSPIMNDARLRLSWNRIAAEIKSGENHVCSSGENLFGRSGFGKPGR